MLEQLVVKNSDSSRTNGQQKLDQETVLADFELCCISREASLLARKEVLTGKAKFGIIGDGKEVPQVAMAKAFKNGDLRSGYYRDQTLLFALGLCTVEQFFAQLYADPENDPFSRGRQMNAHFATSMVNPQTGEWVAHTDRINISSDISSTGGQMARALGLAFASKKYRNSNELKNSTDFSNEGNEICFCTIGDASTSEGVFWETVNAAGVLQVPLSISVWDDGYGISVPIDYQTTKGSISEVLEGFKSTKDKPGIDIYKVRAWDYEELVKTYAKASEQTRKGHQPNLIHVTQVTQPQGHSTSGSHERYKSKERLEWEKEYDCLVQLEKYVIEKGYATEEECKEIRKRAKTYVKECRDRAFKTFNNRTKEEIKTLKSIYQQIEGDEQVEELKKELSRLMNPLINEVHQNARRMYFRTIGQDTPAREELKAFVDKLQDRGQQYYDSYLYSNSEQAALRVPVVQPSFSESSEKKNGFEILNAFFHKAFERDPSVFAFGEDVGFIGDVNQGFAGMQKKFGEERVFDTGIREWTIMGQALGMAMRGLRPIAEIQYLDYLIYGLEPLMDDLATLRWRSAGQQKAPAIIRTRGHRLEGIWHAGSPMGMILNALRGMYVLVPRNMVQAAGFYNTMLQSDDPALIVECLNGYRLKEVMPDNLGEYTVPLGVPEVLQEGTDITLVTYGSCVRVAEQGIKLLAQYNISVELIDVQTLLPFDLEGRILDSLRKTNRIVFMDEDVPGGATSYMLQQVLEQQGGYRLLDSAPTTITAKEHRPPYGSDGDYFTKPNPEDVFDAIYRLLYEATPGSFPGTL